MPRDNVNGLASKVNALRTQLASRDELITDLMVKLETATTLLREIVEADVGSDQIESLSASDSCYLAWWASDRARSFLNLPV